MPVLVFSRRFWLSIAVGSILLAHSLLLLANIQANFVTIDESSLIPAGLSHWQTGTFFLYRVNPPLPRMLAVVPLLFARPQADFTIVSQAPGHRSDPAVAAVFGRLNGPRLIPLVRLARLAGILWSLAGALVIYFWAKELYGSGGALISVSLWCFCPSVLGHGALATTDIPASTACIGVVFLLRRYLQTPSWGGAFALGIALGVAQLTKFTLVLLYALIPVLEVAYWRKPDIARGRRWQIMKQTAFAYALSIIVINLGYGCAGSFGMLKEFRFVSRLFSGQALVAGESGNRFKSGCLSCCPIPFPRQYVEGVDIQRRDFEVGFPSYLRGEWRARGWWYYYLYGLAVKLPLGTLALVCIGLLMPLLPLRYPTSVSWREDFFLLVPAASFLALVSSETGFSHHVRYVYPVIPFILVSAGKAGWLFRGQTWKWGTVAVVFLMWAVTSSWLNVPHSLSYFNELAGGARNGHEHLLNSNIDWGQDALFLKEWVDQHPEAKALQLAYFSVVDPKPTLGLQYQLPPITSDSDPKAGGPHPGWFAVSVNFVRGDGFWAPDGIGGRRSIPPHSLEYFRFFQPRARAGYSIYIYHISPEEANAVRRRLGFAPLAESGAKVAS